MRVTPEEYKKLQKPKKAKYNNQETIVDGITFPSKHEAHRYGILKIRESIGEISDLQLQVKYPLRVTGYIVNGEIVLVKRPPIEEYIADFVYMENGIKVVEDAKGMKTREYKRKKELMKLVYEITIKES